MEHEPAAEPIEELERETREGEAWQAARDAGVGLSGGFILSVRGVAGLVVIFIVGMLILRFML